MNSSLDSNSSARQTSCFQNSVENPITAQMCACRLSPSRTSAFDLYSPPFQPGSDQICSHQRLGEQEVVRGVLRGAGDRRGAQHLVREPHRPLVGLLGAHRPADDQLQLLDAEVLAQQPFLRHHVVADPHLAGTATWRARRSAVGVVRRDGQPVADLVDRDDEVPLRVQRVLRADVDVAPDLVGARVPGGDQDGVVAGLVQLAPGGVTASRQSGIAPPSSRSSRPMLMHVVVAVELVACSTGSRSCRGLLARARRRW